jgi:hypothetical protein
MWFFWKARKVSRTSSGLSSTRRMTPLFMDPPGASGRRACGKWWPGIV